MNTVKIGTCAVVMIVVLRIAIGWHFFYEGLHKFNPRHEFSAKGFLGVAKGPAAPLFYEFLPDIDGLARLKIEVVTWKDDKGKESKYKTFIEYENAWNKYWDRYYGNVNKYHFENEKDKESLLKEANAIFNRYLDSLHKGAADMEGDINAYRDSLARFQEMKRNSPNDASFEQKRRWDAMMGYRQEAERWVKTLTEMSKSLESDLMRLVEPSRAGETGNIVVRPELAMIPNTFVPEAISRKNLGVKQMTLLDLGVTYALTAIGLCMMLGFCNRLACLGGAGFLFSVFLTTWPVPGVYPLIPDVVGHFMFVSKDIVEMIAMIFLATIPAGRWGGLDFFLYRICKRCCPKLLILDHKE